MANEKDLELNAGAGAEPGKRGGRRAPEISPYLTERDIMRITGLSRTTLRNYERKGIIVPGTTDETGYYKYFTLDDLQVIRLAETMRKAGMANDDIAAVIAEGEEALIIAAYRQAADEIRQTRRRLKAIVHLDRKLGDYRAVSEFGDSWYLRYLPQRWMALLPVKGNRFAMLQHPENIRMYGKLTGVIDAVGWASTMSFGQVINISGEGTAARFVATELTSPPMPGITGSRIVDGGCYRIEGLNDCNPNCITPHCFECARFGGRPVEDKSLDVHELREWRDAEQDEGLWDTTLTVDNYIVQLNASQGGEPLTASVWDDYVREHYGDRINAQAGDGHGRAPATSGPRAGRGPGDTQEQCLRPARMPHELRLPLGATACMFPAGVYLCKQYPSSTWEGALKEVTEFAQGLAPQKGVTEAEKRRAQAEVSEFEHPRRDMGPFIEPFAASRAAGDPRLAGWYRKLSPQDLGAISLPVDAALTSQNGFCVVSSNEPLPIKRDEVRLELQVLVNAEALLPVFP